MLRLWRDPPIFVSLTPFGRMRAHLDKTSGYTKDSRSMVFGKQEFVWVKGINNNFQFYIPGQIGG